VDYNVAIMFVHFYKGSLLEYNNVYLAEGPWPAKAQFDALHRARQRDAGIYLDYGFTRPNVFSRGPYNQHAGGDRGTTEDGLDGSQRANSGTPTPGGTEDLPPPLPGEPEGPSDMLPQPNGGSVLRLPASSAAGGTATGGVELAVAPSPDDDAAVVAARSRGSYSWKATGATGDAQARANVAAVRLVDHQQATTQPSSSDDESVENQSTAGTAQSASGWKAKR